MNKDVFQSSLPVFNHSGEVHKETNTLSFWQSIGIVSELTSCHSFYSNYSVESLFLRVQAAIEKQRLIILFNHENRPCGFAIYKSHHESGEEYNRLDDLIPNSIVFENIVSHFSSPLPFYHFLKSYLNDKEGQIGSAYLLPPYFQHKAQIPRQIW